MDRRHVRVQFVAATIGVLCVAGVVRAAPMTAGLPYTSYVDEGHVIRPAAHMLARHVPDPGEYQYPPLLTSAVAFSGLVADAADPDDLAARARITDETDYYDVLEPTSLLRFGRAITFGFALGVVLLTILVGARLVGRFGGLLAGLIVAFLPALVQRSAIVIVDTPATFFVMATLLVALSLDGRRPLLMAATAGVMSAGAFSSKYPSGAVLLAVFVVLAFQTDRPRRTRVVQGAVASSSAVLVAMLVMPALYRRPSDVIDQLQVAADKYDAKSTSQNYLEQLLLNREVGIVVVAAAGIGLVLLLRDRRSRALTAGWMIFAAVLVGSLLWTAFQPFRNIVPIVPYLGIAVVAAVLPLAGWIGRRLGGSSAVSRLAALAVVAALCATMLFWGVLPLQDELAVVDSRRTAREWLQREAADADRIVVPEELAFLPSELERFPGEVTVLRAEEMLAQDLRGFDIALWGRFAQPGFSRQPLPAGWQLAETFGRRPTPPAPEIGRGNHQLIEIYER